MKKLHLPRLAALTSLTLVVAACTNSQPAATATDDGSPGFEIYQASCASCHGVDLKGTNKGPSHLSIVYEPNHHPDESFRSAITNGARQHHWEFGDMEPVQGLSDQDIEDVIMFVRSEQVRQGFDQ